jgi:hypothetical protein
MTGARRQLLDAFMTPLKPRDGNIQVGKSPMSSSKITFSTPAFLRRTQLPALKEDGYRSPPPVKVTRKPFARGLSAIVASLRKVEEEAIDDDEEEAMREMEAGETQRPAPAKILEPDSRVADSMFLGGMDDEAKFDSPPKEQLGRDGQPLRTRKKKGLKRTTRLVNMRPTRTKRPNQPADGAAAHNSDVEVVPETQLGPNLNPSPDVDPLSDSDFETPGGEKEEKAAKSDGKKKPEKKAGPAKKAVRKVNELAHTNFKRLKLRNHGAKGGPGFGSRFRRKR